MTIVALFLVSLTASAAAPLTPEQRALIFGKPGHVDIDRSIARIKLEGTDHRGFYRCPYMKVSINGSRPAM